MANEDKSISVFRQAIEENRKQLEIYFKDLINSSREENENDFDLTRIAEQSAAAEERTATSIVSFNSKLNELLNLQNNILLEIKRINNDIKQVTDNKGNDLLSMLAMGGLISAGVSSLPSGTGDGTLPDNSTQNRRDTPIRNAPAPDTTYGREFQGELLGAGLSTEQGQLSPRELLARTMQAEAGAEGYESMLAVGQVMANRTLANGFGDTLTDVILQPGAFSPWNSYTGYAGGEQGQNMFALTPSEEAYRAADAIISGVDAEGNPTPNRVGRATHFVNPNISNPSWLNSNFFTPEGVNTQHLFGTATGEKYPDIPLGIEQRRLVEPDRTEPMSPPIGRTGNNTSYNNFITGHLKEIGDVNGGMSLYNPTISGQQGRNAVHGPLYEGASNAVRAYWSADQLEAAGLSVGENTLQLTNPRTGQIESVSVNIQSFDGGNTYATTDFIGTGALGESREYWNGLTLEQSKKLVNEMGAGLGNFNLRNKLNTYIQENEGTVVPYSEVDVPGREGLRPIAEEREAQNRRIDQYFRRLDSPSTERRRERIDNSLPTLEERFFRGELSPSTSTEGLPTPTNQPMSEEESPIPPENIRRDSNTERAEISSSSRFPWPKKLIKYYGLQNMIRT